MSLGRCSARGDTPDLEVLEGGGCTLGNAGDDVVHGVAL